MTKTLYYCTTALLLNVQYMFLCSYYYDKLVTALLENLPLLILTIPLK